MNCHEITGVQLQIIKMTEIRAAAAIAVVAVLILSACAAPEAAAGSSYYELLGVARTATTREIRQAFKVCRESVW